MNEQTSSDKLKYTVVKGKRTNRSPKPGDLFRVEMQGFGSLFGRCVANDCDITGFPDHRVNLVYIFRPTKSRAEDDVPSLSSDNLLLPPFGAGHTIWRVGMFRALGSKPEFGLGERLSQHCFYSLMGRSYFDEHGKQLPGRIDPCGYIGLNSVGFVEIMLSEALEGNTINSTPPANVRHDPWFPTWQAERGKVYEAEMEQARQEMEARHRREAAERERREQGR